MPASPRTQLAYTPLEKIDATHKRLRESFLNGTTKPIEYRKAQLLQLAYLVKDNKERFEVALAEDLGRPRLESIFLELEGCIADAMKMYNNVEKWAKPEKPPFSINFAALKPVIRKEPKGTVLIISPFNYPMWLCIGPLTGAIAAGNTVVVKPSEATPATSSLLAELFPKYMDQNCYAVVNGAVPETTKLLDLQWDHLFYTGSGRVGKIVAAAAAKHLTPTTLELGGKCPVFIDPNYDLDLAARRIAWAKFVNSGQTCIAPDYVMIPKAAQEKFIQAFTKAYAKFYPEGPKQSKSFSRIVSDQHFNRLDNLLSNSKGNVVIGGDTDREQRFIAPTVVKNVQTGDSLMSEEIFGPILPLLPVESVEEAISIIRENDHPLAVYVFSNDAALKAKVFDNTQSGAAVANECVTHIAVDGLPFGGTGPSGYGYHVGKYSFDTFTHLRSSIDAPSWFDRMLVNRYPPYTDKKVKHWKSFLATYVPPRDGRGSGWTWKYAVLGVFVGALAYYKLPSESVQGTLRYVQNIVFRT